MNHLSPETLGAFRDGALADAKRLEADAHLESCPDCREALAALAAQDERLARALEHDPGEAYFESFAERVAQRLRDAPGPARAVVARAAGRPWWQELLAPRGLAWAGSAAAVAVVAVIVYVQTQSAHAPLGNPELSARAQQEAVPPTTDQLRQKAEGGESPPASGGGSMKMQNAPAPVAADRQSGTAASGGVAQVEPRAFAAPPPAAGPAAKRFAVSPSAPAPATLEAPRDARRDAAGPQASQSVVTPGVAREERSAANATPPPAPAPQASSAPMAANEKTTDQLQSTIGALKQRVASPLDKKNAAGTKAGATRSLAVSPQESGSIVGVTDELLIADSSPAALHASPGWTGITWPADLHARAAEADALSRRAIEVADAHRGAALFDASAAAWDRVQRAAVTGSAADVEARIRAASQRRAAWSAEPDAARRAAARAALRSVLEVQPAGSRRRELERMLDQLR